MICWTDYSCALSCALDPCDSQYWDGLYLDLLWALNVFLCECLNTREQGQTLALSGDVESKHAAPVGTLSST